MIDNNICLLTDSYKLWHYNGYLPDTTGVYSYLEARVRAKFPYVVFYGLQPILMDHLTGPVVTKEKIDEAEWLVNFHMFPGLFNRKGWEHILTKHGGQLPIRIRAVPEGSVVPVDNALLTVECTDPEVPWLTNYIESLLSHVWYTSTVCTLSRSIKEVIHENMLETAGHTDGIDYGLHDFGLRGTSCTREAALGGSAHLPNFRGTDTVPALLIPINYYGATTIQGHSVAATEHSIMTARGREGEFDVVQHILDTTPNGILSMVIDSYDYVNFIDVCGTRFKQQIDARNGRTVFRPDSGDPDEVSVVCLCKLEEHWGSRKNSKGYKVLPDHIRILWGDGIDIDGIRSVLFTLRVNGWSTENIIFGCGGGLLRKVDRDTQRFAFKCSAQEYGGEWHDVYKEPIDSSKRSKRGRLELVDTPTGIGTIREESIGNRASLLPTVFENGHITYHNKWDDIVARAALK